MNRAQESAVAIEDFCTVDVQIQRLAVVVREFVPLCTARGLPNYGEKIFTKLFPSNKKDIYIHIYIYTVQPQSSFSSVVLRRMMDTRM
jgi:hypothetical protein